MIYGLLVSEVVMVEAFVLMVVLIIDDDDNDDDDDVNDGCQCRR